jgi:hypothetical protein
MAVILRCSVIWLALVSACNANDLTMIVGSATGGVMANARVFAKHMEKYSHGTVTIKIVPGAGGVSAANYLYNVSARDGSEFGTIDAKVFVSGSFKEETAKFDLTKFGWLGAAVDGRREPYILWAKDISGNLVSGSESGFPINHVKLVNNILRLDMRHVVGYSDPAQVRLAFERGEINVVSFGITGVRTNTPQWLSDKSVFPLIQYGSGLKRHNDFPLTPTLAEFAASEDDRKLVLSFEKMLTLGRAFTAPPGVPQLRLAYLRTLFERTVTDQEYRSDAAKIGVIVSPVSWLEAEEIVKDMSRTPLDTVSRLKQF